MFSKIIAAGVPDDESYIVGGRQTFAILNAFPYTSGHLLVMPYREVPELEGLTDEESAELWSAIRDAVVAVKAAFNPQGVNVGFNLGEAAGAGIPSHLHAHVLPRWNADSNFMTSVAEARVLPQPLGDSWAKLAPPGPPRRRTRGGCAERRSRGPAARRRRRHERRYRVVRPPRGVAAESAAVTSPRTRLGGHHAGGTDRVGTRRRGEAPGRDLGGGRRPHRHPRVGGQVVGPQGHDPAEGEGLDHRRVEVDAQPHGFAGRERPQAVAGDGARRPVDLHLDTAIAGQVAGHDDARRPARHGVEADVELQRQARHPGTSRRPPAAPTGPARPARRGAARPAAAPAPPPAPRRAGRRRRAAARGRDSAPPTRLRWRRGCGRR